MGICWQANYFSSSANYTPLVNPTVLRSISELPAPSWQEDRLIRIELVVPPDFAPGDALIVQCLGDLWEIIGIHLGSYGTIDGRSTIIGKSIFHCEDPPFFFRCFPRIFSVLILEQGTTARTTRWCCLMTSNRGKELR